MRAWLTIVVSLLLIAGCGDDGGHSSNSFDQYGGWTGVRSQATGRFRVEQIDGVWWFITPEGNGFFSAAVTSLRPEGDFSPPINRAPYQDNILARYGSAEAWATVTEERLRSWNFNTLGAWSRYELFADRFPHTVVLGFHDHAPVVPSSSPGITGRRMRDYFAAEFETAATSEAEKARACGANPFCVGVFTDNELPWGPGVIQIGTYLDAYMTLPAGAPGKVALQQFFEERYGGEIEAFNGTWGMELARFDELQDLTGLRSPYRTEAANRREARIAFDGRVAERYFRVVHDALRAAAPDVLILGCRFFSTQTATSVIAAAGPYVDVVSVNDYEFPADTIDLLFRTIGTIYGYLFLDGAFADLGTVNALTGKPVMITEYFYRTERPGIGAIPPGFPTVATQAARADAYEHYMNELLSRPYVIGAHWFGYADQPETGRPDGENQQIGLVNIEDNPYVELTERMRDVNGSLYIRR